MTLHLDATIETVARPTRGTARSLSAARSDPPDRLVAGAIIAVQMAQQLCARGRDVPLLVALDGAPCNTGAGLGTRDPRYFMKLTANLPHWVRDDRTSDRSL